MRSWVGKKPCESRAISRMNFSMIVLAVVYRISASNELLCHSEVDERCTTLRLNMRHVITLLTALLLAPLAALHAADAQPETFSVHEDFGPGFDAKKFEHGLLPWSHAEFNGWRTPTHGARKWKDLPDKTRSYLRDLAELRAAKLAAANDVIARNNTQPAGRPVRTEHGPLGAVRPGPGDSFILFVLPSETGISHRDQSLTHVELKQPIARAADKSKSHYRKLPL